MVNIPLAIISVEFYENIRIYTITIVAVPWATAQVDWDIL